MPERIPTMVQLQDQRLLLAEQRQRRKKLVQLHDRAAEVAGVDARAGAGEWNSSKNRNRCNSRTRNRSTGSYVGQE